MSELFLKYLSSINPFHKIVPKKPNQYTKTTKKGELKIYFIQKNLRKHTSDYISLCSCSLGDTDNMAEFAGPPWVCRVSVLPASWRGRSVPR